MNDHDQKPTDTIPPITNTQTTDPLDGSPLLAPDAPQDAAAAGPAPHPSGLSLEQFEYIDTMMKLTAAVGPQLDELGTLLGHKAKMHLIPITQDYVKQFNSEGPLATDDPALRRNYLQFGISAKLFSKIETAAQLVSDVSQELAMLGNALVNETRRGSKGAPERDGLQDFIDILRASGKRVEVVNGGSDEMAILQQALDGAKKSQSDAA